MNETVYCGTTGIFWWVFSIQIWLFSYNLRLRNVQIKDFPLKKRMVDIPSHATGTHLLTTNPRCRLQIGIFPWNKHLEDAEQWLTGTCTLSYINIVLYSTNRLNGYLFEMATIFDSCLIRLHLNHIESPLLLLPFRPKLQKASFHSYYYF